MSGADKLVGLEETDVEKLTNLDSGQTIGGIVSRKPTRGEHYRLNGLIYGDSGVGKTTLLGSASEVEQMSPVLHLDIEDGSDSLSGVYDKVEVVPIKSIKDLQNVFDDLRKNDCYDFKTVNLDNITELQNFGLDEIMAMDAKRDPEKKKNVGFLDPDTPDWPHYNASTTQMRRVIRGFRALPCHTLFAAHETLEENEKSKRSITRPALTNKASKAVPGFVHEVWYYYQKGGKRRLHTEKTALVIAKSRARLPANIEEPTMADIWKLLTE